MSSIMYRTVTGKYHKKGRRTGTGLGLTVSKRPLN